MDERIDWNTRGSVLEQLAQGSKEEADRRITSFIKSIKYRIGRCYSPDQNDIVQKSAFVSLRNRLLSYNSENKTGKRLIFHGIQEELTDKLINSRLDVDLINQIFLFKYQQLRDLLDNGIEKVYDKTKDNFLKTSAYNVRRDVVFFDVLSKMITKHKRMLRLTGKESSIANRQYQAKIRESQDLIKDTELLLSANYNLEEDYNRFKEKQSYEAASKYVDNIIKLCNEINGIGEKSKDSLIKKLTNELMEKCDYYKQRIVYDIILDEKTRLEGNVSLLLGKTGDYFASGSTKRYLSRAGIEVPPDFIDFITAPFVYLRQKTRISVNP